MPLKIEQIPLLKSIYNIKKEYFHNFEVPWHIHAEYELVYIYMNNGIKYVGSYIGSIEGGEILLIGPNLPHNWLVEKHEPDSPPDYQLVVHFPKDVLGAEFFELSPFKAIKKMLDRAELGVSFKGGGVDEIGRTLEGMIYMNDLDRTLSLLSVLRRLSELPCFTTLSSYGFNDMLSEDKVKRLNKVFNYITLNYKANISLQTISEVANMTPQAFCNYFKERTRKTFVEFVNEVRVGHACKLLLENNFNVLQVCYESGFNNLSNFNRQFKKIMGVSPTEYRRTVLENVGE